MQSLLITLVLFGAPHFLILVWLLRPAKLSFLRVFLAAMVQLVIFSTLVIVFELVCLYYYAKLSDSVIDSMSGSWFTHLLGYGLDLFVAFELGLEGLLFACLASFLLLVSGTLVCFERDDVDREKSKAAVISFCFTVILMFGFVGVATGQFARVKPNSRYIPKSTDHTIFTLPDHDKKQK